MEYFIIIISSIFVNNVVLSQFLGICPFLGVSNRVGTSLGMGAAVTFVMAISSIVAYLIQYYVLVPLGIQYMQTIVFILVIAALVQMVEIIKAVSCDSRLIIMDEPTSSLDSTETDRLFNVIRDLKKKACECWRNDIT